MQTSKQALKKRKNDGVITVWLICEAKWIGLQNEVTIYTQYSLKRFLNCLGYKFLN